MSSPKFCIPEPLSGVPLATWFQQIATTNITYKKYLPPNFFDRVCRAATPADADVIILPNNFLKTDTRTDAYIAHWAAEGERNKVPVYAFSLGDFTDGIRFDHRVHVFRLSLYRATASPRDIALPALTEDNAQDGITLRDKRDKPAVSFCGMGDLDTVRKRLGYHLKNLYYELRAFGNSRERARKLGVYWRRQVMAACARSPLVATHFIVRKTFSGSRKTIELDPAQARKEYLESIINSDFVIAPKGDGNYSARFFKTLCMGRIPIIVDTDSVLPLEGRIDYSKIAIRVPMERVRETPRYVREFYDVLSPGEWQERQKLARHTFETFLRQDSFFKYFFGTLFRRSETQ